jgi:hypothetical protein
MKTRNKRGGLSANNFPKVQNFGEVAAILRGLLFLFFLLKTEAETHAQIPTFHQHILPEKFGKLTGSQRPQIDNLVALMTPQYAERFLIRTGQSYRIVEVKDVS